MTRLVSGRFALALRNVFRHRSRTVATLLAIGLGVTSMILAGGFVRDVLFQLGEATIHSQTGHLQLAHSGYWASRSPSSQEHMIEDSSAIKKILTSEVGIEQVVSRINFVGMLNNGNRDLGIIGDGIEPDSERKVGSFMQYVEGRPLSDGDSDGMVIGQGVARALNLSIGDRVTLVISLAEGAVNTLDFQVIGIFQSFSKEFDARAIRIPLIATQTLLDTKAVHLLVITLEKTETTEQIAKNVGALVANQDMKVFTWRELSDFYEKTVQLYGAQFGVLRLIICLMVLLSVVNSVNMTLYERTREFGTVLAIGDRPQSVFQQIMIESLILGLIGAGFGIAFGFILASVISAIGIPMPPPPNSNLGYMAMIRLDLLSVVSSGALGFGAAILASIYPAYRAGRVVIVDALRQGI